MSLIVEDGTGLEDAESYISVADADAYHEKRGNTAWDVIDDKEALLRKATDFMLGRYRARWRGVRKTSTQSLDWPRLYVAIPDAPSGGYYSSDSIPAAVKNACASLALKAYSDDLLADQGQRKVSVQVGPISTTYDTSSSPTVKYPEVDEQLNVFLKSGSGAVVMERI